MSETKDLNTSAWTIAAKDAIILALFTIVPQLISALINGGGAKTGFIYSLLGFLLWAVKFGGSLWFLYRIMKLWSERGQEGTPFSQGMKTCLLSSIICAAFAYLMYAVLFPGMVETVFAQVTEQLSSTPLPSEAETMILRMEDNFAMISFVSTLIWCIICGWLFSGIISGSLKRASTPFDGDSQTQDDELL